MTSQFPQVLLTCIIVNILKKHCILNDYLFKPKYKIPILKLKY